MVGFVLCCSSCCVIVGLDYAVCCIGFKCHTMRVMVTGAGENLVGSGGFGVWLP